MKRKPKRTEHNRTEQVVSFHSSKYNFGCLLSILYIGIFFQILWLKINSTQKSFLPLLTPFIRVTRICEQNVVTIDKFI